MVIVAGAIVLYLRPHQRVSWGVAILVAAVISLLFGGGGLVGAVLAIVGEILALTWHAPGQQAPPSGT